MFSATLKPVIHGRKHFQDVPNINFLQTITEWAKDAPNEIFDINQNPHDVFSSVYPDIGPWGGPKGSDEWFIHRKAVMLEIMRVLGGFESTWNWNEGKDQSSHVENDDETKSSGLWQISYNSRHFGQDLKDLIKRWGIRNGSDFQILMRQKPAFAMEYAARLFRHTVNHNGPLKRKEVNAQLSLESIEEFRDLLRA